MISFALHNGQSLWDLLIDIYQRHGLALSSQKSFKKPGSSGAEEINQIMHSLRNSPPEEIAGSEVIRIRDYLNQTSISGKNIENLTLPKSNVLAYDLLDNSRVIVRPSGTEPKIKFYLEAKLPLHKSEDFSIVSEQVKSRLEDLTTSIMGSF